MRRIVEVVGRGTNNLNIPLSDQLAAGRKEYILLNNRVHNGLGLSRIKDSTVLGLTSGLIGTIPMDIIDLITWRKGKTDMLYGHLAGSMIFTPIRMHRRENFIIGKFMHFLVGSGIGGILTWFLKKTGKDHHIFKGCFIGMLSWLTLFEFGQRQKWFTLKARKSSTFYYAFLMNLVHGATTAQAIVSLADPSVFEANPSSANESNARRNYPESYQVTNTIGIPDSDSFLHHNDINKTV